MSSAITNRGPEIATRQDLVAHLASGSKPKADWRIGTEHEKFVFRQNSFKPVSYEEPNGIRDLLNGMKAFGWQPVMEQDNIIGHTRGSAAISLEPGGQFELSGAPLATLHQTADELAQHFKEVGELSRKLGLGFLGLGFHPAAKREDIPWMPKGRYRIMRKEMERYGTLGHDMMLRTCTVQVNLDYASEADMVRKVRVAAALQPIATALFAASPFTEGKPNGFNSARMNVWSDTDPRRCGFPEFFFEDGFGFERYVDYALSVPMYFVYRDGNYIDATGQMFGNFLNGTLAALPGERPRMADWADHLTTLFPDVRVKKYIEMRGADCSTRDSLVALPAFWTGLLYDGVALDRAWELVKDWTREERKHLHDTVPKQGLRTPFRRETVLEIARKALKLSQEGLRRRGISESETIAQDGTSGRMASAGGYDESAYLDSLVKVTESGQNYADETLTRYRTSWKNDIMNVYKDCVLA